MQAKETKIQDILEGTKQYNVPLFQRTYSWNTNQWKKLWDDILELCESEKPRRNHFLGSLVNMPTNSSPEDVTKFVIIDGQQRLTTISIILAALRDNAQNQGIPELAEEINNTLLVNPYKKENSDFYKILPTQVDRQTYYDIIYKKSAESSNLLYKAYNFYKKAIEKSAFKIEKIKNIITNYLFVISIVLDKDDNAHLIFESLNADGQPLTQADLIRNNFFMKIPVKDHENTYDKFWKPLQEELGDNIFYFIDFKSRLFYSFFIKIIGFTE